MLLISTAPPEIVRFVMGYKKFAHHSHSEHFVWQLKGNGHVCREATLSIVFLHSLSISVYNERKRFRVDPSLLSIYLFFVCLQVYKKAIKKSQKSSGPCKNSEKKITKRIHFPWKDLKHSKPDTVNTLTHRCNLILYFMALWITFLGENLWDFSYLRSKHQVGPKEHQQSIFWAKMRNINHIPANPNFPHIQWV